jgi:dipeptidase E
VFDTPDGELRMILVKAQGVGLVDFAIILHVDNADHQDMAIPEQWTARIPAPTYAIDDQTAIKVTDGDVEVVSEGHWKLFTPSTERLRRFVRSSAVLAETGMGHGSEELTAPYA